MASFETNETLRWHDADWLGEVTGWIDERVVRTGEIDMFHAYPWATAIRVPTPHGIVWFKACVAELAHEVTTLELINARRPGLVPRLLAGDRAKGWMLLEDAGERMRELEQLGGQLGRWEQAVALYAQLQLDVAAVADTFADGGVPDRRSSIAHQIAAVFADERATEPLDDEEVGRLDGVLARIRREEGELDALGVPYSIQHDDLHDANIFLRDGSYRIIDWGDACIANPLLSLTVMLAVVEYRFDLVSSAPEVARVCDAYLEPFAVHATPNELARAVELARRVGYACGTLKWYEVWRATSADVGFHERLRRLLEVCG